MRKNCVSCFGSAALSSSRGASRMKNYVPISLFREDTTFKTDINYLKHLLPLIRKYIWACMFSASVHVHTGSISVLLCILVVGVYHLIWYQSMRNLLSTPLLLLLFWRFRYASLISWRISVKIKTGFSRLRSFDRSCRDEGSINNRLSFRTIYPITTRV